MRKIVIAPDSFKGTLTAKQVCTAAAEAARSLWPDCEILEIPVADGGEGTVECLAEVLSGNIVKAEVKDPLGRPHAARYAILPGRKAILEMAEASGLLLVDPAERDVLFQNTCGTGEMLLDAVSRGCRELYLGIGGSATNDGGMGFAAALGVRFLDAAGRELRPVPAYMDLVERIELPERDPLAGVRLTVMCDVTNPLLGKRGATYVYGGQKGVAKEAMKGLDRSMGRLYDLVEAATGRKVREIPGAGAAGGLGAALLAFTEAKLRRGAETVLELTGFREAVRDADLVITGEGSMDYQSAFGKITAEVGDLAKAAGVPCMAVVGRKGEGYEKMYDHGIVDIETASEPGMTLAEIRPRAAALCREAAERLLRRAAEDLGGGPDGRRDEKKY